MSTGLLAVVLLLVTAFTSIQQINAWSACMTDVCPGSHPPSIYEQYCCFTGNSGKTVKLRGNNHMKILLCPPSLPSSCQRLQLDQYNSCSDILEHYPNSTSGYYNLTLTNGSIATVYCDMEGNNCDGNGGWMRVGYVNMTQSNATCPEELYSYQFGSVTLCDRFHTLSSRCDSTLFSTIGLNYTQVCGQVRGYQFGAVDGIYPNNVGSPSIDGPYVDGVSITHGTNPRQHIWTYAAGQEENDNQFENCPCNNDSTQTTPAYVGNDYYCESGLGAEGDSGVNDPLWDGEQCNHLEVPCCTSPQMPWFHKTFNQSTTDDIELRLCSSEGYPDESVPVDIIELYIR